MNIFEAVKRWILYTLIVLTVDYSLGAHQLHKIPLLFTHYQQHQQRDPAISFLNFLSMHYWGDDINDQDDQQDMSLPFKKADGAFLNSSFFPAQTFVLLSPLWPEKDIRFFLFDNQHLPKRSLESLFRPPQA